MSSEDYDDGRFLAGFVLNKLYLGKCFARRSTGKHQKHIQLASLPTGLPGGHGDVLYITRKMNGKLVKIFKSTGHDHICALIDDDAVKVGLELCNYYRKQVKLPLLDRLFREIVEEARKGVKTETYRKLTDKEKRNKKFLEDLKKWGEDKGLATQSE